MVIDFMVIDVLAPVFALIFFATFLFFYSFFVINVFLITKDDDLTIFEKVLLFNNFFYNT